MKILGLKAENFKRLHAIELAVGEDESLIEISGANGQGKSSVLDAVWETLGGGAADGAKEAVRLGEEVAEVSVRLGGGEGGEEYIARRRWKRGGKSTITLSEKQAGQIRSPQAILDMLFAKVAFDPGQLLRAADKKQVEIIRRAVGLETEDLDNRREGCVVDRGYHKRQVADAGERVRVLATDAPDEDPGEAINSEELRARVNVLNSQALSHNKAWQEINVAEELLDAAKATVLKLEEALANKKQELGQFVLTSEELRQLNDRLRTAENALEDTHAHDNKVRDWKELQWAKDKLKAETEKLEKIEGNRLRALTLTASRV